MLNEQGEEDPEAQQSQFLIPSSAGEADEGSDDDADNADDDDGDSDDGSVDAVEEKFRALEEDGSFFPFLVFKRWELI